MKHCLSIFITLSLLMPEAGHSAPLPTPSPTGTPVTATCDCDSFKITATKLPPGPTVPAGDCVYNLMISQTYPTGGHVPKGIKLTALSPTTFATVIAGPVVSSAGFTQTPPTIPPVSATVQWYGGTLPNNSTPQSLATIVLNANGVSPQQILVEWLDEDGITMCHATLTLNCPCKVADAVPAKTDICFGQTTTVTLNPAPPSTALVTWWKAPAPCPPPIPSNGTPTTGWQVAQVGGNTCNTNVLPNSTCYQAVITEGPTCAYTSHVATVNVGQVPSLANLTPSHNLCHSGMEAFTIINPYTTANPGDVYWEQFVGGIWQPRGTGQSYTTPTLTDNGIFCSDSYLFRVRVGNPGCGYLIQQLPIQVDHLSDAGTLVATPPGPLCYKQATKIKATPKCGVVVGWEQSTDGGTTWTSILGAGTTMDYWTPELTTTTIYRVTVKNGTCGPVTNTITVNVKPQLAVSLSSNGTVLCPGPITLTAQPPNGYPPPLTYTWYRNGVYVSGPSTSPTLVVNQPGNYRVVISDPACGTAKSNVISIYPQPKVLISGPCGICQGKTITLQAVVTGGDPSCVYTFNWSASPGTWTGSGQTVNVSPTLASGASITYNVTATCAGSGCTVPARLIVTRCPP